MQPEQQDQSPAPAVQPSRPAWEVDARIQPRYGEVQSQRDPRIYAQMSQAQYPIPTAPQHTQLPLGGNQYGAYAPNPYAVGAAEPPPPQGGGLPWKWIGLAALVLGGAGVAYWYVGKGEEGDTETRANGVEEEDEEGAE